jgi:hypothetical protein
MCSIALGFTIAATVAEGFMQFQQSATQVKAAKMQNELQQKNWLAVATANRDSALANIQQLNIAQEQTAEQGKENMTEAARKQEATKAKLMVASGETGVSGNLVSALRGVLDLNAAEQNATLESNISGKMEQLQYEKEAALRRGTTVGTGPQNIIMEPSPWNTVIGAGLQIGGDVADYYDPNKNT